MSISLSSLQQEIASVPRNARGYRIYPKKQKNAIVAYATANKVSFAQLSEDCIG